MCTKATPSLSIIASASTLLVSLALVISGCASAQPVSQDALQRPASQPQSAPRPGEQAIIDGHAAWEETVAAARREGKIVIMGSAGTAARDGLTQGFQERYPDIQVDYTGQLSPQLAPKILAERQAGQHITDLYIGGTGTLLTHLLPAGVIDPVQPFLVGPDIQDTSRWLGGTFDFSDDASRYNLVFAAVVKAPWAHNPRLVAAGELRSYRDLLDPKWRGKLVMSDPGMPGAGLNGVTHLYMTPSLGKDYLRELFSTGLVISKEPRQILDWVARGQYHIALAPSERDTVELMQKGVPIELFDPETLREEAGLTVGPGSLAVITRPPHPNALKVYLNWLLSKEGQTAFSREADYPSLRLDVPTDHVLKSLIPKPGVQYINTYKEPAVRLGEEIDSFLKSTVAR
jgi:iron(III) transport system substrate-binding protein